MYKGTTLSGTICLSYTVVVYDLRMCMKEDNPFPKNTKRDNLRENTLFVSDFSMVQCEISIKQVPI